MMRLWSALDAPATGARQPLRGFFVGQFIALAAAVAVMAAHLALGPLLVHSIYLLAIPAAVAVAAVVGPAAGLSATAILTVGAFAADAASGFDLAERIARAVLLAASGLAAAWGSLYVRRAWEAHTARSVEDVVESERHAEELRAQLTQVWSLNS